MGLDPSTWKLRCPSCGLDLFERRRGDFVLRNAIIKLRGETVVAKCPASRCPGEAIVPFLSLVEPPKTRRRILVRSTPSP